MKTYGIRVKSNILPLVMALLLLAQDMTGSGFASTLQPSLTLAPARAVTSSSSRLTTGATITSSSILRDTAGGTPLLAMQRYAPESRLVTLVRLINCWSITTSK